jgi:GTPase
VTVIDDLLREFPEPVRSSLRAIWAGLPATRRAEAESLLGVLPTDMRTIKDISDQVLEQQKTAFFQNKHKIAIVGPANVGKSTLYNQLITHKTDRAAVSPVPGTTRQNQTADAGLFNVIDTPGVANAGEAGTRERKIAFEAATAADFMVIVFDAGHGIQQDEVYLFGDLRAVGKPFIVVLNKIDLVAQRDQERVVAAAAHSLGLEPTEIITTQATKGKDVGRVVLAVAKAEPGLLMALAAALPEYRARLAWQRIVPAATASAGVALIPLPIADIIPLLGIQTGLILTIARIYGFDITPARAKELMVTFGLGFGARTLVRELAKLGGVPGWVLSAAIASSTTVVMGYAATVWFAQGERPSQQALQQMTTELTLYLRDQLAGLGKKRPEQETLRQRLSSVLNNLPPQLQPVEPSGGPLPNSG